MKKRMKSLLCALLAISILVSLCACGAKKDDNKKNNMQTDYTSLYEYAQKLEENGDNDAAAAVYEIIIRNGGKDLANAAREKIDLIRTLDEIDEINEIFGEGGDAK